jgi:hypothetical protein
MSTSLPPFLPETMSPVPFYCEENIYRLCEAFIVRQQDVSAIFISNESKTVRLWVPYYGRLWSRLIDLRLFCGINARPRMANLSSYGIIT